MIKVGKVLLIVVSLMLLPSSPVYAMDDLQETKKRGEAFLLHNKVAILWGVGVAAIVAAAAGIYHWCTREESNEKMYTRLNHLYTTSFDRYNDDRLLYNKPLINSITEEELVRWIPLVLSLQGKLNDLPFVVNDLQQAKNELHKRIARDAQKTDVQLSHMNALLAQIKKLIEDLTPINEFWYQHQDFFKSYKVSVGDIALRYKEIIEHSADAEFIKRTIMMHAVNAVAKVEYPYIYFVNRLKNDISELNRHRNRVERYPRLYERLGTLIGSLHNVLALVVILPEYTKDLELKKQHELEQERIAIERARAEAERERVHVMAQQVATEREKVAAMYHQVAAEREKAQAIKEQTLVQLTQQKQKPQQITINVQPPAQAAVNPPQPAVAPILQPAASIPSHVAKFFEAIENMPVTAVSRLDFHIPQIEQMCGPADQAFVNGYSLISAAIEARNLDAFNKAELITWLRSYGIQPTSADKQKAQQTGQEIIIKAVMG